MSLCQGGSFKSGFASGALGSFGASAWGAMVGDKFAKSAVGTIAFGALSGGVGAELTDGNFWQGVVIGGMVAGLNHTMHQIDPPGKKGSGVKGEKLNWFNKSDGSLYDVAESDINTPDNTLTIYTHGNPNGIVGPDGIFIDTKAELDAALTGRSKLWDNYKANGGKINIVFKACGVGSLTKIYNYQNFARLMSKSYSGLTAIAPSDKYVTSSFLFFSWESGVNNNGTWNGYYNNKLIKRWFGN